MTTTLNMSYQSNPASVSQGGSGVASTTAYGLMLGGTTTTGPLQNAGTGTTGQLYLGAGSGIGTWTNNDVATCFQYIGQTVASSSASIEFTGLSSTYFAYRFILDAIVPATNAAKLYITFSTAGGYLASGYTYAAILLPESGTVGHTNGSGAVQTQIVSNGISNTASVANHWEITLFQPSLAVNYGGSTFYGRYKDSTSGLCTIWGEAGCAQGANAFTKIKFAMSSGNISTGTITAYGVLT